MMSNDLCEIKSPTMRQYNIAEIPEEITDENFPKPMKDINPQF